MKKFVGSSIQEALHQALCEFSCAPNELEYEVVLSPRRGILGFLKRDAIILAQKKSSNGGQDSYSQIQNNFFQDKPSAQDIGDQIAREIKELFSHLPYEIDQIKAKVHGREFVFVEFNGVDCGLLIGEKGYRYHAIYHLLSAWIKKEYGMNLRLEIADFLKNKEKKVEEYLEEYYDKIISRTFFQTQAFDSLSASIALKRFRETIPDKYIVMKQISENESVIVVNDFR
ncbi:Jag N-terminal domain-containing protein [Helicobacter kayseriensis]|uniref:Jag N-terminal domain-containing protein n=1 Tax=Helicobacter kayseriensis TaxID=2905877 RepID=UPI001E461A93|nr:Jag N-terminal domain-containing protein [Helicobacter kayseriensis]MCE3047457.1 Jag N-terminal domain-containing protein [Helicobacter kayseriensis]MCE3048810.1 Jag N-terminal domain-containing protein [Helicobacter kayseriensis]